MFTWYIYSLGQKWGLNEFKRHGQKFALALFLGPGCIFSFLFMPHHVLKRIIIQDWILLWHISCMCVYLYTGSQKTCHFIFDCNSCYFAYINNNNLNMTTRHNTFLCLQLLRITHKINSNNINNPVNKKQMNKSCIC